MGGVRWSFRCGSWTPTRWEWLLASRCVQREERDRIGQFMFTKDAKSAMAGRLLLRRLVCEKMSVPWADIRLERTPRGKPYLASPACSGPEAGGWSFNLSHQGDYAVLAAEQGLQVGVDVMKTTMPGSSSVPEFFRVMSRQFTEHEWSVIRGAGSEWEQLAMFYRHWALKESFIKAIGTGLGFNLQRAEFHLTAEPITEGKVCSRTTLELDEEVEEGWIFEESLLDQDHQVAVALGTVVGSAPSPAFTGPSSCFTLLSFSELISMATPILEEDTSYWESFQKKAVSLERQGGTHR